MDLVKGIEAIDKSLYLQDHETLIISDLHLGMEEQYRKKGVLLPSFLLKDILDDLKKIFSILNKRGDKISRLVINGDLKHEFGKNLRSEWSEILSFMDKIGKCVKEIIIVKGNHDIVIDSIAKKTKVKLVKSLLLDDILILHGDVEPEQLKYKTVIIGHEHPAVSLQEGGRVEKYKCFLTGRYKRKTLIAQPSFHLITQGTDVLREKLMSPILQNTKKLHAYIVEEGELLDFGEVENI